MSTTQLSKRGEILFDYLFKQNLWLFPFLFTNLPLYGWWNAYSDWLIVAWRYVRSIDAQLKAETKKSSYRAGTFLSLMFLEAFSRVGARMKQLYGFVQANYIYRYLLSTPCRFYRILYYESFLITGFHLLLIMSAASTSQVPNLGEVQSRE